MRENKFQGKESDRLRILLLCRTTIESCLNLARDSIERGEPEAALNYLKIASQYSEALFWSARYPECQQ